jgi:hypothetical protein
MRNGRQPTSPTLAVPLCRAGRTHAAPSFSLLGVELPGCWVYRRKRKECGKVEQARSRGIAIGASTTFLTPIGHQANVLVYGVGNHRFADFPRTGALLNVVIFIAAMIVVPLVWPFAPLPGR